MCFVQGLVLLNLHFLIFKYYPIIILNILTNTTICASMKQVQKTISQQVTSVDSWKRCLERR